MTQKQVAQFHEQVLKMRSAVAASALKLADMRLVDEFRPETNDALKFAQDKLSCRSGTYKALTDVLVALQKEMV